MRIGFGNDHSALALKSVLIDHLKTKGIEVIDYGTNDNTGSDYPEFGAKVGRAVVAKEVNLGLLLCGTGLGISLAANKIKGVRAAVCSDPFTAKMSKEHNNCNILALGARVLGDELAKMIVDVWLESEFEVGGRHQRRVNMLTALEEEFETFSQSEQSFTSK